MTASTGTASPIREGFRIDRTHRVAALLVWALTLVVSVVTVWPAWQWWSSTLGQAPRGDVLVDRVDLVVLKELVQFDRGSMFDMTTAALSGGIVLALLLNPLFGGGVIGLLIGEASGATSVRRFFDSGIRFYGRFFRALLYVGLVGFVVCGLAGALITVGGDALSERGLERAWVGSQVVLYVVLGLFAAFFTAVLDLARIRVARSDSRHVLVACVDACRLALRRLGTLVRIGGLFVALLAVLALVLLTIRAWLPGGGWLALGVALLLQQALACGRVRLRVATIASLAALTATREPSPLADDEPRFAEYDRGDATLDAAE